jgi:TolB-like protein
MKTYNVYYLIFLLFLGGFLSANPSIAVIDFDSGNYCTAEKAAIMTDLFRNELIRSGRADIVDRRNIERIKAELRFQMSDYADPGRIKQMGRMIGADYLMTGNFDMLGDTLYLVVQMLDIETARALYSSRMTLVTWDEYDRKVRGFAEEFIRKLPQAEIFTGTWSTDIPHNDLFDTYEITFTGNNRCTVKVTSTAGGAEVTQEAAGTYSYDGTIFKVNAVFRNSRIPHISAVQWSSVLSFNDGNTAFNILAKPASNNANQVRVTFTKE